MNKHLSQIYTASQKPVIKIIGLMSGTSLDGLDIAYCECSVDNIEVLHFQTIPYPDLFAEKLKAVQSKWDADVSAICRLNAESGRYFGDLVLEFMKEFNISREEVDVIASHGQTIFHKPDPDFSSTLQIADADHISLITSIPVISDFRQKHVAAGGEGAPLAGFLDEALFRDTEVNRILLNLGGIANLTWLPALNSGDEVITTDIGPANTLINEAMSKYFGKPFDRDGEVASSGTVHTGLQKYILLDPFFRASFPKSTGQEVFNLSLIEMLMESHGIEINPADLISTLTSVTSKSISRALDTIVCGKEFELFISGGGMYNQELMKMLKDDVEGATFRSFEALTTIPADAKEAALMAYLAFKMLQGETVSVNGKKVTLGKISLPG
jgi:anhydro-N-acetylmuramic acid kinase